MLIKISGPLLIHGPTSADWDIAWDPIFLQDWIHDNAFRAFVHELHPPPPVADSILLGGQGKITPEFEFRLRIYIYTFTVAGVYNGSGSVFTRVVEPGKRILLRLINAR